MFIVWEETTGGLYSPPLAALDIKLGLDVDNVEYISVINQVPLILACSSKVQPLAEILVVCRCCVFCTAHKSGAWPS